MIKEKYCSQWIVCPLCGRKTRIKFMKTQS
ncbi:MAG: hypothetical protein IJ214_03360 [Clostridia bacterium]|nr:hypothetical protein [Clostridia bacterium]